MKVSAFVKEFSLCITLSSLADAIDLEIRRTFPNSNLFGNFLYLLYMWFIGNGNFIIGLVLFSIYFFVVVYLVRNSEGRMLYWLLTLWAVFFIVNITINDWNLSLRTWAFSDYLVRGSHYAIFAVMVAMIESLIGKKNKLRRGT